MPYCNPKANGEVQKLKLNTTKPRPAAGMFVKDEPIVESPKAMDFEEGTLEGPPQVVRAISFCLGAVLSSLSRRLVHCLFVSWFG
jgi:hypothetical protein